jgi:hypothetical protein
MAVKRRQLCSEIRRLVSTKCVTIFWGESVALILTVDGTAFFPPESLKLPTRIDGDTLEVLDVPSDEAGDSAARIRLFIPLTCTSKI